VQGIANAIGPVIGLIATPRKFSNYGEHGRNAASTLQTIVCTTSPRCWTRS
jgi:hypothetical protein